MAERAHTTPPPLPPLPTIAELGRRLAALDVAHDHYNTLMLADLRSGADDAANRAAMDLISQQSYALRDLIPTMPAATLADATVQIAIASELACHLCLDEYDPASHAAIAAKVDRLLLSIVTVVAQAAGTDLDAVGWDSYGRLRADRFHGLEGVA